VYTAPGYSEFHVDGHMQRNCKEHRIADCVDGRQVRAQAFFHWGRGTTEGSKADSSGGVPGEGAATPPHQLGVWGAL